MPKQELPQELRKWFTETAQRLWPIALGSLSLRKSPCIRKNCSACASGKGHLSYALSGYQGKHRFSVYIPDELAPEVQAALNNGRRLQDLMKEPGLRYVKARKRARQSELKERRVSEEGASS
jgi:molybdopterin-guanine dinucleotide biosynthesis protein A